MGFRGSCDRSFRPASTGRLRIGLEMIAPFECDDAAVFGGADGTDGRGIFHDFRQETMAGAEANSAFQLEAFMEAVSNELIETGFIEGFEFCHYRAPRGMRVDGYWFNDEGALDLFVADFDCRRELESLTRTEVDSAFKRVVNFFEASSGERSNLRRRRPNTGLSRQIADRRAMLRRVNFFLVSERVLSDRFQACGQRSRRSPRNLSHLGYFASSAPAKFPRPQRAARHRFRRNVWNGIPCLPAHLGSDAYHVLSGRDAGAILPRCTKDTARDSWNRTCVRSCRREERSTKASARPS